MKRVRAGLPGLQVGIRRLAGLRAAPDGHGAACRRWVKISKRAGSYVTLRDLIDEVGRDATRYFFVMRKGRIPSWLLILIGARSMDNPVLVYCSMPMPEYAVFSSVSRKRPECTTRLSARHIYQRLSEPAGRSLYWSSWRVIRSWSSRDGQPGATAADAISRIWPMRTLIMMRAVHR